MKQGNEPSLRVLVYYHKPAGLFKSDVLTPFHCGRLLGAVAKASDEVSPEDFRWCTEHCLGDDAGDNISLKNGKYSELVGHYWAWKNYDKLGNPDYIGFIHYRRIMVFSAEEQGPARTFMPFLNEDEYKRYLKPEGLNLGKYDMYVPHRVPAYKFKIADGGFCWATNPPERSQVKNKFRGGDIGEKVMLEYIRIHHPAYYETARAYYDKTENFQWNMFIFRRELFFEYAQFLFDVAEYLETKIYHPHECTSLLRRIPFLSEHLTGIFIEQKIKERYKVKYLSMIHIIDPSIPSELTPVKEEKSVAICCAADNTNSYMCEVMISSIIAHASESRNYDIVVLWNVLSRSRRKKMLLLSEGHPNVKIRLYNVNRYVERRSFKIRKDTPLSSLFPLSIPQVFKNYEKVLYLKYDTIAQVDIAELYDIEMGGNYIAACNDLLTAAKINSGHESASYYEKTLGLKDPWKECVSTDVMLINVGILRKAQSESGFLRHVERNEYKHPTQDIFNKFCYGHILMLDPLWNVCAPWADSYYIPSDDYWVWLNNLDRAKVISYRATASRPWNNTGLELASNWWQCARQSPVYEELLTINTHACIPGQVKLQEAIQILQEATLLPSYQHELKCLRWKILFSWGKRKRRYLQRKENIKMKIKIIERYAKQK